MKTSPSQFKLMVEFMEQNGDLSKLYSGPYGKIANTQKWKELTNLLNKDSTGIVRSMNRWRKVWSDLKNNTKKKVARLQESSDGNSSKVALTRWEQRVLNVRSKPDYTGLVDVSELGIDRVKVEPERRRRGQRNTNIVLVKKGCDNLAEYLETEPAKLREDAFITIERCCVNMVKKNMCSLSLFDDAVFNELLSLIPMSAEERRKINSEYIRSLIDERNVERDSRTIDVILESDMDKTADSADYSLDPAEDRRLPVKNEVEIVICTCNMDHDKTVTSHHADCPSFGQETYCKYFEVSLDSATCQICNKTLTWSNISTLKKHLQTEHASLGYQDDCHEQYQKSPLSENLCSANDLGIEEVYLDENVLTDTGPCTTCTKKRKLTPLAVKGPMSREKIAASLQRLKSLDNFGPYVVSLMKLIPKDKCIKFQIEMVERLLQEQAAAA